MVSVSHTGLISPVRSSDLHRLSLLLCPYSLSDARPSTVYWIPESTAAWRVPIAFQIIFALIILAFVMRLPESPRWLVKAGHLEEAAEVFAALQE